MMSFEYRQTLVKTPDLTHGKSHPNSLRHLAPYHSWTICIDETGNQFGDDKLKSTEQESGGKLVALAVPKNVSLPDLSKNFHAVDFHNQPEKLDTIINEILSKPVGVVGIHYKDKLNKASPSWLSGIYCLIELTLRLLPLNPQKEEDNTQITIYIEQRGKFTQLDSKIMADELKTQLKSIDQHKYKNLGLTIQFVSKEKQPYNGYVDTIAHSWGGGFYAQERRKKAKFSEHCFINLQDDAIERLYAMIDGRYVLTPNQWYDTMMVLSDEPEHSILHQEMERLGKICTNKPDIWQSYLHEVHHRLQQKSYQPHKLAQILTWIEDHLPTKTPLSPQLQLQLYSAKLASQNHLGRFDADTIRHIFKLGDILQAEIAPEVANTYIRIATAATNAFDFDNAKTLLNVCLFDNTLAIGRLNHIKHQSSLGQIYAFKGEHDTAQTYFQAALLEIDKLTDNNQRHKEYQQTHSYVLLNLMDNNTPYQHIETNLQKHFGKDWDKTINTYAIKNFDKFNHHVLLRALVQYPELHTYCQTYLKQHSHWHYGTGHPWQAINFWRGWLLAQNGQKQLAQKHFDKAIDFHDELKNNTLLWIYLVFSVAIERLGFQSKITNNNALREILQPNLPLAPFNKLDELEKASLENFDDIKQKIALCLPFNFK